VTAFCSLCGNTNSADLGPVIGICLDADACHDRQDVLMNRDRITCGRCGYHGIRRFYVAQEDGPDLCQDCDGAPSPAGGGTE
jgi:hypothetical protein